MRTVGDFKAKGGVIVNGDQVRGCDGFVEKVMCCKTFNETIQYDEDVIVKFLWRDNKGVKPEFEGLIDFVHRDGDEFNCHHVNKSSICEEWYLDDHSGDIIKWRPHLPASIQTETPEEKEAFEAMNKSPYDVGAHVSGERFGVMSDGSEVGLTAANDANFDKPVYTQAMADAGEKVSKGMMFATACGEHTALEVNDRQVLFEVDGYFTLELHEFVHPIQTEREKAIDEIAMVISNEYTEVPGLVRHLDMFVGAATAIYDAGYRKPCSNNK